MKTNQKGFGLIETLIILVIITSIAGIGWFVYDNGSIKSRTTASASKTALASSTPTKVSSTASNLQTAQPVTIKGTTIQRSDYYSVTLTGNNSLTGNVYYGKVQKINDNYIRLTPAYYVTSSNTLMLLGKELHAPEPIMYINLSSVAEVTQLTSTDKIYQAILASDKTNPAPAVTDAYPSASIDKYIKTGQYQVVFFNDGTVYFAKLQSVTTDPLFSANTVVFTLKAGANNSISLMKVDPAQVATHKSSQVIYWNNLVMSGQVSAAISTFLRNNP